MSEVMEQQFITRIRTNLNGVLEMTQMFDGLMMTGDNLANRIIVELNRDGVPVQIPSDYSIIGYIIRNDGYTLDLPGEVTSEGYATIVIPQIAYEIAGPLSIAIRMISGDTKIVIATASCYVNETETNSIIDTSHRIPDVEELLSYIEVLDGRLQDINSAEELRNSSENQRITNEASRVAEETQRIANEAARDSSEIERIANEATRESNEATRVSNEATRVSNEAIRVDNDSVRTLAEEERLSAESQRVANEIARDTAEGVRNQAESQRVQDQAARLAMIDDMTVEAVQQENYTPPTAVISEVNGHKHIRFGFAPGDPFVIRKVFSSVSEMNAYSGTDISEGQFAIINSNIEDPDNAKLYMKTSSGYSFITDLSGAQGIRGPIGETGNGIASTVLNQDYTLTINFTDGTSYTTPNSIRGAVGATGNGIASIVQNPNYTLTINYTDGTSFTTPVSVRGETGVTGNGIASTVLNPDYTLTINFTDGTSYTTPDPIRGAKGETGLQGNGISSVVQNADYTMTINFENGDSYTTPFPVRGAQGEPGINGVNLSFDGTSDELTIEIT